MNLTGWPKWQRRLLLLALIIPGFAWSLILCLRAGYHAFVREAKLIFTNTADGYETIWCQDDNDQDFGV